MKSASPDGPVGLTGPCWYTASSGGDTEVTPGEVTSLRNHLSGCLSHRGRWFHWRRRTDVLLAFVASRLITTALAMGLVAAVVWLL